MVADGERMCEKMRTFAAMKKPESPLWRHPVVWLRRFRRQALRNIQDGVRVIDMGGDPADVPDTPDEDAL